MLVPLVAMLVEVVVAIPFTLTDPNAGETPLSVILEGTLLDRDPGIVRRFDRLRRQDGAQVARAPAVVESGDPAGRLPWLMALLLVPGGGTVKIVEQGVGPPVVFLHSGVGSAGEWRDVFSSWPRGHRLIALDAYKGGTGPGVPGHRTLDDFADQVHAVVGHVGEPVHLIGLSWGGATALHVAATAPGVLASLAVVEPEAYSLLKADDGPAFATLCRLRDGWREYVRAGRWYEAFEEFVDFYNGPGSFARWPAARRDVFLKEQRARGDLWDVLLDAPITAGALASVTMPVHVVEGSATSVVDRAICELVLRDLRRVEHTVIEGAGHMMPLTHPAELGRALVRHLP